MNISINDLVASGHRLSKRLGEPDATIVRELATRLDTQTALAKARIIPEGWKLVPASLHLLPSDIESICAQCGDGGHMYGDFVDGTLSIGIIEIDNGSKIHGLHISNAEYPEEGAITIAEFDSPVSQESTQ